MGASTSGEIRRTAASIVGEAHAIQDPARLAPYFLTATDAPHLVAVHPQSTEEVQKLVQACAAARTPIFTTYDTYFPEKVASQQGILLDFDRMNAIERIDSRNLCVHIQRGVTFEQLEEALKPEGLTALVPAAASTRSVVCHAVARGMNLSAAKYPEVQVTNMQVVLQDGRVHRTGSHANSEEMADWKEDGGPNLSKWYLGADDIFGIVVRGSIWVYPRFAGRHFDAFSFQAQEPALKLLKDLSRKSLPQECLVLNQAALAERSGLPADKLPPWVVVSGVEAFPELAAYQQKKIRESAAGEGGKLLSEALGEALGKMLTRPWYVKPNREQAFHTLFARVPEFDGVLAEACRDTGLEGTIARTYVANGLGRSVWCRYGINGSANGNAALESLAAKLASAGAYFDRPQGRLAEQIYGRIPTVVGHIKRIKNMMDEKRIFNPGRPVQEV